MCGLNIMKGFSTSSKSWTLNTCPTNCHKKSLPIPITMKAISKMKSGKAADPSGIVVEMIKAASDTGTTMIHHLFAPIIHDGKVPTYWMQSFIVCLYKGKGAQWLSGRVLDWRPKGRGFEPHWCHCVVVLEQDTFILA